MRALLAAAGAVIIGGCAAAPFQYRAQTDIPEGPGMLTGAAGAFSLRPAESLPPRDSDEYREFQEWREWKRQQRERKN
ncbi:MAG: hypothetical protein K0R40_4118 [Burkholderiales bacterium]|nr:hypothetical protein [Burkholderiales bacterium]